MYEAVKRYETYVAHNKRLEGKDASSSASQPKAAGHTSGYKPRFHKTTVFVATIPETEDHWKYEEKNGNGPLQLKGPPLNKSAQERAKAKPPPSG